jgi:hypothetical protein
MPEEEEEEQKKKKKNLLCSASVMRYKMPRISDFIIGDLEEVD